MWFSLISYANFGVFTFGYNPLFSRKQRVSGKIEKIIRLSLWYLVFGLQFLFQGYLAEQLLVEFFSRRCFPPYVLTGKQIFVLFRMKQNRFLASFFKLGEIKVFNFLQLLTRNLYEGELSI